jgi:heme a synthase
MDGVWLPSADSLFVVRPWIENFVDNHLLVQFDHRLVAYLLLVLALIHAVDARLSAPGTAAARRATAVAGLVLAQAMLGIATLLLAVPLWAALTHQVMAMMVLSMATVHARLCRGVGMPDVVRASPDTSISSLAARGA